MSQKELIVITGASHGIGKALALRFAKVQYPLLLISRQIQTLPELADSKNILYTQADVADYATLANAIASAEKQFGTTGCLINNAGFLKAAKIEDMPIETCHYEIDVLFKGVVNGVKAVLPGMQKLKRGTIINISSIADRKPGPQAEIYHACKAAVRSFSESLQQTQAENNIRVINFAPGLIKTEIHKNMGMDFAEYSTAMGHPDFIDAVEMGDLIYMCWQQPQSICIRDIVVMPTRSAY